MTHLVWVTSNNVEETTETTAPVFGNHVHFKTSTKDSQLYSQIESNPIFYCSYVRRYLRHLTCEPISKIIFFDSGVLSHLNFTKIALVIIILFTSAVMFGQGKKATGFIEKSKLELVLFDRDLQFKVSTSAMSYWPLAHSRRQPGSGAARQPRRAAAAAGTRKGGWIASCASAWRQTQPAWPCVCSAGTANADACCSTANGASSCDLGPPSLGTSQFLVAKHGWQLGIKAWAKRKN